MNCEMDVLHSLTQLFRSSEEEQRRVAVSSLMKFPFHDVRELLYEALGDESWRVRKEALEVLFKRPVEERVIEDMVELLRSSDNAGLRNSACEALEKLGERSLPVLCRHVEDHDHDVRKFVIDVLGAIALPEPVPLLIKALSDSDLNVSSSAAENLGKIGDERAVPALVAVLDRSNISLCYTVLEALGLIGKPFPLEKVMPLYHEPLLKKPLFDCLGAIGATEAVPMLIEGLTEKARHVRSAASTSLLMIRDSLPPDEASLKIDAPLRSLAGTPFAHDLIRAVSETGKRITEPMVRIFGLLGDPRAAMPLLEGCRDDRLRSLCLQSFREIGDEGVRVLINTYPSSDDDTRCYITFICGELKARGCVGILVEGMRSSCHMLRRVAAVAAGNAGAGETIPDLEILLDDAEIDVRVGAVDSLAKLADSDAAVVAVIAEKLSSSANPEKRKSSTSLYAALRQVDRLARLIKDEEAHVRTAAVFSLAELKDPESVRHLVMALVDEEPNVRMAAAGALGEFCGESVTNALMLALKDPNQWVVCAALRSLATLRVAEAESAITELAGQSEGVVLIAALRTMLDINTETARRLSAKALEHSDPEVVKTAIEILMNGDESWIDEQSERLLSHEQWDIRSIFIKALAEHRGLRALSILRGVLESETDDFVRRQITGIIGGLS